MDRKRILMIDDDPAFCGLVSEILAETDCEVTTTTDYREGLRLAMIQPPDLILLDIHMPEVSGLELIRQLRNMQSTRYVPVMMVTGDDSIESVKAAREYSAVGYLLKPFKPLYLIERIGQLMGVELVSGLHHARLQAADPSRAGEKAKPLPVVKTRTLLVIDDEPVIFQLIQDLLEDSLLKVETASDAREGLRKAMTLPIDVILLDANMPDVSGLQAAEQLKHMRNTRNLPVILMSGQAPESLAAEAEALDVSEFLAKPFTPIALMSCLQRVLKIELFR